jgi:hypothetical protein
MRKVAGLALGEVETNVAIQNRHVEMLFEMQPVALGYDLIFL